MLNSGCEEPKRLHKVTAVAGIYFSAQSGKAEKLPIYPEIPTSWKAVRCGLDFKEDLDFLLKGISEFDIQCGSIASAALVHGPLAFPICTTDKGEAFLAGSYFGLGRVILVTHEGFLQHEKLASFWKNAFHWLDQGRDGVVGFEQGIQTLPNLGLKCETTEFRQDLSVFVCPPYSSVDSETIQKFVAEGGGLVIGGHVWNWAATNTGKNPMKDFSGNKILNKTGLSLLKETITSGVYKAPDPSQVNNFQFRHLLHRFAEYVLEGAELSKQDEEHLKRLGGDCASFLRMKAYDSFCYVEIMSLLTDILKKGGIPKVSEKISVKSPKDHMLLSLASDVYEASLNKEELLPQIIKVDPVPVVKNQSIKIQAQTGENEEWISTGLYLSPGMKTKIILPPKLVNTGWKIQIGCQSDELYKEELWRAPYVIKRFPVTTERMQVCNMWGGLIYLLAPRDVKVEEEIVVEEAVSAPYYKSGVTKEADWSSLRKAPAPWAEMEFDNIILTVPSHIVRDLESPLEVGKIWNDIMKGVADLAVIPQKFIRKERIVADVQISVGYMHAGYPVMMHSNVAKRTLDAEYIKTNGLWGELHELGHNQQRSCWEFPPNTTEATCNLWPLYINEEVLGVSRAKANDVTPEYREKCIREYVEGGRKFSDWYTWTALETYMELQDKFGWDTFKKVFAIYHEMKTYPRDNEGKINLYAETFSRAVKMNLTGFFKAWGWPIKQDTEKKLSDLPLWTDHPMAQYA
ncbi:TRPM8 channel-associated factor homolog [Cyprinodon tularosa]|uniref:TRPM8 channel-associated factor homolog n=1 Tax=Cyprinodon tularosa TaxID=77115 RepID=UPI0018E261A6|nr:TRPM8 channel-associated factor homolog [Cyprinodon tularosa]